ncbi:MAG TPA: RICIN domain-containing protein [Micromonosporaceae bacterium]|nr:RICIN domain-containing protein [Micromonosporaceae bacterium]
MPGRTVLRSRWTRGAGLGAAILLAGSLLINAIPGAGAAVATTAWQAGRFTVDKANVVRRSNIVLGQPNNAPAQYLPLGNGTLGAAVWAANGFTAQLNRTDTFPDRKSPGQVLIPGLAKMTGAADFTGVLDLYDGVLRQSGGGMTMTAFVRANTSELVVDVTGADPATPQTATVRLWAGRTPTAAASGAIGTLAETWVDNKPTTGSGQTFGTLAAITAGGRNVIASVVDPTSVRVSFQPNTNGSYRVVVGAPRWTGGNAQATATALLASNASLAAGTLSAAHLAWWHAFWNRVGLITMSSADGSADYLENLRTVYLYTNAAESRGQLPGSHAGVADLFNFGQDYQRWYPAGYWFWNLRMHVASNISAGTYDLNTPVFDLYLGNLANIQAWTKAQMGGREGICVPETMRFNGNGYQNDTTPASASSCNQNIGGSWNARTVSTGAEISGWIWQQYQHTQDRAFLTKYYPILRESAKFLLAFTTVGADGYRHAVANAHENQWNVLDPTTNLAAMQALFPATAAAAQLLGVDASLITQLRTAQTQIPPYPRTDAATHTQQLTAADDASGQTVIADSYQQSAAKRNVENIGLETVWPYGVISDNSGALTALAQRTYANRQYRNTPDWTFDAIQAARLGLPTEVKNNLINVTKKYQTFISGMASWQGGASPQPYIEQAGVLSAALSEALVQDYDGLLRIAPAWPTDWTVAGTVAVAQNTRVHVQVQDGTLTTVAIEAGTSHPMRIRNPWSGQQVRIIDGSSGATVLAATTAAELRVSVTAGRTYLVERVSAPTASLPFAAVTGTPASVARHLGNVQIGLDRPVPTSTITARHSGKVLDLAGGSTANGVLPVQQAPTGAPTQRWRLTATADGYYRIVNTASGRCLDVSAASIADGAAVLQWTCGTAVNQQWSRVDVGGGYSQLRARHSGKCLDVTGGSMLDAAVAVQFTCAPAALNQQWLIR